MTTGGTIRILRRGGDAEMSGKVAESHARNRLVLHFPPRLVDRPIMSDLVRAFDLRFNILKASIEPNQEGLLVLELEGEKDALSETVSRLKSMGVRVQPLGHDIVRNEERCTHCGACLAVCPTEALEVSPGTRLVIFDSEKCIACELCVGACPPRAMEVRF